jgi:hypothetical protein
MFARAHIRMFTFTQTFGRIAPHWDTAALRNSVNLCALCEIKKCLNTHSAMIEGNFH